MCRLYVRMITVGGSADDLLMQQLYARVLAGAENIEYLRDPHCGLQQIELKETDLTVISVCADTSIDTNKLVASCAHAAASSSFTVAMVPVQCCTGSHMLSPASAQTGSVQAVSQAGFSNTAASKATASKATASKTAWLKWLKQLAGLVDVLVLVPDPRQAVPADIAGAIPLLISGSGMIGIDYADIKVALTVYGTGTGTGGRDCGCGVYVALQQSYTDTSDIALSVEAMVNRMHKVTHEPLGNCVSSVYYHSSLSLQDVVSVPDTLYEALCTENCTIVSGAPMLPGCDRAGSGKYIICIGGRLELDVHLLDRLAQC